MTDVAVQPGAMRLERYFGLSGRGASAQAEMLAGFTTFLTMAYIVLVNPAILGQAGVKRMAFSGIAGGVDPALLALARKIAPGLTLRRCVDGQATAARCLAHAPKFVVGGTGVSAGVYADNAEFRDYLAKAWHARVLDMESAAVVQVAYANQVPAIVFRSLSDLAGGDAGANQMTTFMALASVNSADVVRAFVAALPD